MSNAAIPMNGLHQAEYFDVRSDIVGDDFRIFVAKPFVAPGRKYPAVYVLDGNSNFALVMCIQRMLAWGFEIPDAYVIGVGYPTEASYSRAVAKRNRDYIPTEGGIYAHAMLGPGVSVGGPAFLRFLTEELQPALRERYQIDPQDTTLQAASLGGLFAAWLLLTAPTTFRRYVLVSPAIAWNFEEVWRWEQAYAEQCADLRATVFVSAGSLETATEVRANMQRIGTIDPRLRPQIEANLVWFDAHGWPRTDQLAPEFASKLRSRNYPGLHIHCHNMPDETHASVPASIISRGLRYVFGHWRP